MGDIMNSKIGPRFFFFKFEMSGILGLQFKGDEIQLFWKEHKRY